MPGAFRGVKGEPRSRLLRPGSMDPFSPLKAAEKTLNGFSFGSNQIAYAEGSLALISQLSEVKSHVQGQGWPGRTRNKRVNADVGAGGSALVHGPNV